MQIITIAIQKGGTGKTTTTIALAQAAALKGFKTLVIDLDPQGNTTFALGAEPNRGNTSYDLIAGNGAKPQVIANNLDVIPAAWELATLKTDKGSARRLQGAIKPFKKVYDYIFIDTPPTAGELQYNALQASDGLIVPILADIYNIQSLYQLTDTARRFKQNSNPDLSILGFIFTQIDTRSTIARDMQEKIIVLANKNNIPYLGSIHKGVAIQEAAALRKNLFEYAPKSAPAQDYMSIFERLSQ